MIREEKADMRKSKRMIALVLVLVMVLTSITFSSGSSQAEDDTNSGNDIVLNFPESEKNNVDLSNYGLSVKNKSDGKEVADVTSYATATDAKGNKNKIVIADRKLTNGTTYVAEVTSSNWTGYKYKAEFKYDGKGQSVTLDKYLTKMTIKFDKKYTDITVTTGDKKKLVESATGDFVSIDNCDLKEGTNLSVTAKHNGLSFAGNISAGSSDNVSMSAQEYKFDISDVDTGAIDVSYTIDGGNTWLGVTPDVVIKNTVNCKLKYAVKKDTDIIDSVSGASVNESNKKVVNGKFEVVSDNISAGSVNADGIVKVGATARTIGLQDIAGMDINVPASIAPEIPFNVSYTITMKYGLNVPNSLKNIAPEFSGNPSDVAISPVKENGKVVGYKVDASNISSANRNSINKTVSFNLGDASHTYTRNLTIKVGDVVYGRDFEINSDQQYPQSTNKYFYRQDNGDAKITVKSGQYSYYRYKIGTGSFNDDFVKITGTAAFSLTGNGDYLLQMKTENEENKFGVSNTVSIVKDDVKPTLEEDRDANTAKQHMRPNSDVYVLTDTTSTAIILNAADTGSGISRIVWSDEERDAESVRKLATYVQRSTVNVIGDAVNPNVAGVQTIVFYAIDNVGNVSDPVTYKVQLDNSAPEISCEKFGKEFEKYYKYTDLDIVDGKTCVKFVLTDDISIKSYSIKATMDGKTTVFTEGDDNLDVTKVESAVPIETDNKKYSINVVVKDRSGNSISRTYNLIVDSIAPAFDEDDYLYAEPVEMKMNTLSEDEKSLYKDYDKDYTAYNSSSKIKWKYTEENPDSVTLKFGKNNSVLLGEYTASGETDMILKSNDKVVNFWNESLGATALLVDMAGNKNTYDLRRDNKKNLAENIVYTNESVKYTDPKFNATASNTPTIKRENGEVKASVDINVDSKYIVEDFIKVTLSKVGEDDVIPVNPDIKIDDKNKVINFIFNANDAESWDDGKYRLNVYYYDIASGTIKKATSDEYVYDKTAPVLKSKVDKENGEITYTLVDDNPEFINFTTDLVSYNNDNKITADNKDALATADVTLNENDKAKVKFSDLPGLLNQAENWIKAEDSNEYTAKIKLTDEGVYSVNITAFDTAENKTSNEADITYDITAPRILGITVEKGKSVRNTNNSDYSYFGQNQIVVRVLAKELVGTSYVTCNKADKDEGTKRIKPINKGDYKNKINGSEFTYYYAIGADFKGKISFSTKDSNGNSSKKDVNFNKGIIVESEGKHDSTASSKLETLNPGDKENGIYNETVRIKLSAQDTYSGLQEVAYTVKNGNTVLDSSEVNFNKENSSIMTKNWHRYLDLTASENKHKFEGDNITVTFTGKDNSGNVFEELSENYNIDVTKPVIESISYGSIPANSEFNQRRTVTIRIREHNFDTTRTNVTINKNGSAVKVPVTFTKNGDVWTGTYTFVGGTGDALSDGDYSNIRVESTDLAGNKQVQTKADRFTIDGTKPTMTITYDNNNAKSGSYYGEARTATITVNEHNFAPEDITVDAKKDGTPISISGWSGSGDTHVATVSFNADGNYTISASCKDRANNQGNSIEAQAFTVDLTKPEVVIEGVTNGTSYTGSVLPVVKVTDTNYDENGVVVTLVGGKNGVRETGFSKSSIANGQTYSFYDLERTQKSDDIYKLTVKAVDKAGHETTQTVSYRVNRFGSIYSLSRELESAVDSYYAAASDKFAIYEQNVDEVKKSTVSYTIDNEIVNLEEGKDYTVRHSEDKAGWNQYEYILSKDSFSKEGVYTVSVSSEDSVGNISDNKSKGVDMEFCIDNTAPVCIVSGVEDGQKIERDASANIGIEAYDNIMFATMKVELNGEQIKSEADLQDGKLSFTVSPTSGEQTLKVTCYDAAGNEKIEEIHFTFDVSILNSHLWIILVIIAICIVLLGMVIIIVNKKRRANQ